MHEEERHRFADDVAATEDDGIGAFDLDVVADGRISMHPAGVQATRPGVH